MCAGQQCEIAVISRLSESERAKVMGGGGGGGMSSEQRFYQQKQLELQEKSMELSRLSVVEPVKSVDSTITDAADATARAAQLRKGIASTFNRPTAFTATGGNTSGTGTKLGD